MATLYHQPHFFHCRKKPHPAVKTPGSTIHCSKMKNAEPFKENKQAQVDYDAGTHKFYTSISGIRKSDLPKRNRLRVEGDRFQKDWTVSEVVERIIKLNHWEDIEGVLNRWAGRFARRNYPILIREITNMGSIEHSIQVFNWLKNQQNYCARNDIYNMMIRLLARHNHIDQARGLFFEMQKWRCKPDVETFNSLIHAHGRAGQWRWGMNIMEDMLRAAVENCHSVFNTMVAEGQKPNIVSYNTLLGAYASVGLSGRASLVFDEMKQNGLRPDVVSYTSLLNSFGRSEQPRKARKVFDMMRRNNCNPNLVTYNALIDAYGSNGFLAEAVDLLREMEQVGLQPNVVSISSLLAACGRCCQHVKIDSVLKAAKLRGIKLNTIAYNSAMGSYMNVGEYEKALSLYRCMREKRVKPDSVTYNILISGCCKLSKYSEALEFLGEMRDLKIPPSKEVYSSAICAYSRQGQLAEAELMFNMMKNDGLQPDVIAYTAMLHACSAAEHWEKAFAVFQEMELNNVQPDSVACAALMRAFNRGSQPSKALLLAELMKENNIPFIDGVFFEMVSACSILRDWKTLTEVIKSMETSLPHISVGTLNHLLHSFGKVGKIDTMMKLFLKIVASGAKVDSTTYAVLLKNLLASGHWRKYVEVMQWMEDAGVPPSAQMYKDILLFAQTSSGTENAAAIRERVESLKSIYGYTNPTAEGKNIPSLSTNVFITSTNACSANS